MDIKVYRFINSHAMTQIIFLSKTFCNDFIKYIFNNINSNHEKYLRLTAILLCSMHLLGSASLQAQMNKWVNYSPDLTTVLKNPAMGWMMYEEG
jgi:hypothetical protein